MVERCSAIDGTWGLRAENVEMAKKIAKPLMEAVRESEAELVAGDCHLANTAISEDDRQAPVHPLQVLARAYGHRGASERMRKLPSTTSRTCASTSASATTFRRQIIDAEEAAPDRARRRS